MTNKEINAIVDALANCATELHRKADTHFGIASEYQAKGEFDCAESFIDSAKRNRALADEANSAWDIAVSNL